MAWSVAFNHDGTLLAIGGHNHSIQLWPVEEQSQSRMLILEGGQVWSVAFSHNSQLLASGDDNGNLALWTSGLPVHQDVTISP
jgi:WD40 repeat protein